MRFRHLLEEDDLARSIFREVRALLEERGLVVKQGTIAFQACSNQCLSIARKKSPSPSYVGHCPNLALTRL